MCIVETYTWPHVACVRSTWLVSNDSSSLLCLAPRTVVYTMSQPTMEECLQQAATFKEHNISTDSENGAAAANKPSPQPTAGTDSLDQAGPSTSTASCLPSTSSGEPLTASQQASGSLPNLTPPVNTLTPPFAPWPWHPTGMGWAQAPPQQPPQQDLLAQILQQQKDMMQSLLVPPKHRSSVMDDLSEGELSHSSEEGFDIHSGVMSDDSAVMYWAALRTSSTQKKSSHHRYGTRQQ